MFLILISIQCEQVLKELGSCIDNAAMRANDRCVNFTLYDNYYKSNKLLVTKI